MIYSTVRGHAIELRGTYADGSPRWVYSDTGEQVKDHWQERPCGLCGLDSTPEGHDGCLGTLPDPSVTNACCGHGKISEAYVQFNLSDEGWLGGQEALDYMRQYAPRAGMAAQQEEA